MGRSRTGWDRDAKRDQRYAAAAAAMKEPWRRADW